MKTGVMNAHAKGQGQLQIRVSNAWIEKETIQNEIRHPRRRGSKADLFIKSIERQRVISRFVSPSYLPTIRNAELKGVQRPTIIANTAMCCK